MVTPPPKLARPPFEFHFIQKERMMIGERLRELRENKDFSQGDIEQKTGLLRCYLSRVENGHTIPSLETLEKIARALEIPMYELFVGDVTNPKPLKLKGTFAGSNNDAKDEAKLRRFMAKMPEREQKFLLFMATKLARESTPRRAKQR
jgi:transcriptional regulator with XRE-family HTH domain